MRKEIKLIIPTGMYGLDEKTRKVNESIVNQAFSAAHVLVSCQPIDLTEKQAESIMRLPRNNPMYRHELEDLAKPGNVSCLVTLRCPEDLDVDVSQVVSNFLPLGLDKFQRREFSSKSPILTEMYGNSLYARFMDATTLQSEQ